MATIDIAPVHDETVVPDDAKCQEASSLSRGTYIPCLAPAVAVVRHEKDRRAYYMCGPCADHNVRNRGGRLMASRETRNRANLASFPSRSGATPIPPLFQIPEEQSRALSDDIAAQIAGLPTTITDAGTYRLAKESLPLLKRAEDKVVSFFKDMKEAANRTHKAICSKENEQLLPIKGARQHLSTLIYGYEQEQARLRQEQERRAAEDERRRQEQAALEEAASLSLREPELAQQIVEQAIAMPTPVVVMPSTNVDVAGVSSSQNWQWDFGVSDLEWDKLPQADRDRVMRLLPREYCRPDDKVITKVVKAMKGGAKIPGIRVFDKGTVRTRG